MYMVIFLSIISVVALIFLVVVLLGRCLFRNIESTGIAMLLGFVFAALVVGAPLVYYDKVDIPSSKEISSYIDIKELSQAIK